MKIKVIAQTSEYFAAGKKLLKVAVRRSNLLGCSVVVLPSNEGFLWDGTNEDRINGLSLSCSSRINTTHPGHGVTTSPAWYLLEEAK